MSRKEMFLYCYSREMRSKSIGLLSGDGGGGEWEVGGDKR